VTILLLNAGSSSLKASLVEATGGIVASGAADWAGETCQYRFLTADGVEQSGSVSWRGHRAAVMRFVDGLKSVPPIGLRDFAGLTAVGHRVVHGGEFRAAVRITPQVRRRIQALCELAPLHNPPSLEALAIAEELLPRTPHIAVFDTAFHATLPPEAYTYPLPRRWTQEWGIRRYGFHGLSHSYCSRRAADLLGRRLSNVRLVICHLGHGCSASAVQSGQCIDTTMGFTPLDGLMMATRSGSIDPAIITYVQERHRLTTDAVETALNREAGLLGVSGISGDMRQVLAAANSGNDQAQLAIAIYARRVRQTIGASAATMGGIDALVFTAGVGEHSAQIRALVCQGLECLGLKLDEAANRQCRPDADISAADSTAKILVLATREDEEMLREVLGVLEQSTREVEERER
jgi:acetate kinase